MKKKAQTEPETRPYRSELREAQAQATRDRIVDAAVALLAQGQREITYAALAREARVSTPTIYRHFPTRPELFEAVFQRVEAREAARRPNPPADFQASLGAFFDRFDDEGGVHTRAARLNTIFEFSRSTTVPRRRAWLSAWLDREVPGLPEPQRTWLLDLGVLFVSSSRAEAARGYLDLTGAETAERIGFAMQALLSHARTLVPPEDP